MKPHLVNAEPKELDQRSELILQPMRSRPRSGYSAFPEGSLSAVKDENRCGEQRMESCQFME